MTKKTTKTASAAAPASDAPAKNPTRVAQLYAMLTKAGGSTINEIAGKFGWARHSARGLISTSNRKFGWDVSTAKIPDRGTVYSVSTRAKPQASGKRTASVAKAQAAKKPKPASKRARA